MTCNSGARLTLLLVKQQRRQFQFCAPGPAVFLVLWCTGTNLVVLSQEIGVDTPHFSSPCPSSYCAKCDKH
jgi:hypothetical protein